MSMNKILIKNNKRVKKLYFILFCYLILFIIIPFIVLMKLENSLISVFLTNNPYVLIILLIIFFYFLFIGVYYAYFKIDSYIINISSSKLDSKDNMLDIKHSMLENFFFKKSIFSWNTVLYINFMKKKDSFVTRKFYFSLLGDKEKEKITLELKKILKKD